MTVIRSVTTRHSTQPNIEYRVGINTTRKADPSDPGSDEKTVIIQTAIVEVYHRSAEYEVLEGTEWKCIGRYTMDDFIELNRDVVKIGRDMLPPETKADDDEPSLS